MVDIEALKLANARRWAVAKLDRGLFPALDTVARRLVAADAKGRYLAVAQATSVPWFIVAVIHERESAQSWAASLAQGDPWNAVSIHVPTGRGPFASWADAAIDALDNCPPRAGRWDDWSAGGALTLLEQYNGLGYAAKGRPSPYVWASTDAIHARQVYRRLPLRSRRCRPPAGLRGAADAHGFAGRHGEI